VAAQLSQLECQLKSGINAAHNGIGNQNE
jgi:hypothetical protein